MTDLYDAVPYPGSAFQDTHPDRLATLAFLHGLNPAPAERCRVLELGAGSGGNLIPHAWRYPESTFLGLDRAGSAVASGNATIHALDLRNVRLETVDLLDVTEPPGEFDYIIAHGVFSWVPEPVRRSVLRICQQSLAPNGVAFISYLALPGTHLRNVFRDAMLFHVRGRSDTADRVRQARAIAQLIADMPGEDPYRNFARSLISELNRADDAVLFHDYLAEINAPFYFMQFVELAAQHGLQFLSEAEYPAMFFDLDKADQEVRNAVEQLQGNVILREQYYDFLRCRQFRQTLLVRNTVHVERPIRLERLLELHAATALEFAADPEPGAVPIEPLTGQQTRNALTDAGKAALRLLALKWPATTPVHELLRQSRAAAAGRASEDDDLALLEVLHRGYQLGQVELWRSPVRLSRSAGDRPMLSPVARYQLARGPTVCTLKHLSMEVVDPFSLALMRLLDGTRDRAALIVALAADVASGRLPLDAGGTAGGDEAEVRSQVASNLEEQLHQIARAGLLVEG